ncbi:YHYH protein [Paenibacillus thalictri]|uniref:YHYH protein n=1 Tax=Paenibacillus thalictri TaxID=2527873 RepID=A0A4Q9DIU8_9BACL|nr:YHYH protein [Paenibacillus thalictri]TBL72655.1 YHYH protein [Paenibacillus thalictri]
MKKYMKLVAVAGISLLVAATASLQDASAALKTITAVVAKDINLGIHGAAWTPTDSSGETIYPVVIDGVSYLPVRSLAQALNTEIGWEDETRTIIIGGEQHSHASSDIDSGSHSHSSTNSAGTTPTYAPPLTALPIGDGKVSTDGPKVGYVYVAKSTFNGGGSTANADWFNGDGTYDSTKKPIVDGSVLWNSELTIKVEGDKRIFTGNKLPDHPTGNYPVARNDDAYNYDRNPNTIGEHNFRLVLPANPTAAAKPSPLPMGAIGIMTTGSVIFNAVDDMGRDAAAHEIQDKCSGHPESSKTYHYHNLSPCIDDVSTGQHSPLIGYALDGFGIYGKYGESGELLSNADLDELHGHTHVIEWDGKKVEMYHYHVTNEYPYTLGGYKGTPVKAE